MKSSRSDRRTWTVAVHFIASAIKSSALSHAGGLADAYEDCGVSLRQLDEAEIAR